MKTYPVSGFWRNIMPCPADHELLSAQRVVFQLKKYMKLYHLAMVQRSRSSASDAMVDFFERDLENSTLSPVYNLTARYTFSKKEKTGPGFYLFRQFLVCMHIIPQGYTSVITIRYVFIISPCESYEKIMIFSFPSLTTNSFPNTFLFLAPFGSQSFCGNGRSPEL